MGTTRVSTRVTANIDVDVNEMICNVVSRLLEHPCSERRGAKDTDKDTLLVRRGVNSPSDYVYDFGDCNYLQCRLRCGFRSRRSCFLFLFLAWCLVSSLSGLLLVLSLVLFSVLSCVRSHILSCVWSAWRLKLWLRILHVTQRCREAIGCSEENGRIARLRGSVRELTEAIPKQDICPQ